MLPATRRGLAVAVAGMTAVLAGCPFAQPVPGVSASPDGGTVTPPRIDTQSVLPAGTVLRYETNGTCPNGGPAFSVSANVKDENTDDSVEARWFVDYQPLDPRQKLPVVTPPYVSPAQEFGVTDRPIPPFVFEPTLPWSSESTHLVELVISNGFAPESPGNVLPYRSPLPGFETQVFRWVFVPAPGSAACGP